MRIVLVSILFFSFQVCLAQDYILEYRKYRDLGSAKELVLPFNYELRVSEDQSSFEAMGKLPDNKKFSKGLGRLVYKDGGQAVVVYDGLEENHKTYTSVAGNPAIITNHPIVDWEISQETQMINGYLCYKALGTVNDSTGFEDNFYTAWFTPAIPIEFGPPHYYNLPGLVLFGTNAKGISYLIQSIKSEKEGSVQLGSMPDVPEVDYKVYVKKFQVFMKENSRK